MRLTLGLSAVALPSYLSRLQSTADAPRATPEDAELLGARVVATVSDLARQNIFSSSICEVERPAAAVDNILQVPLEDPDVFDASTTLVLRGGTVSPLPQYRVLLLRVYT